MPQSSDTPAMHGTTVLSVRRNGKVVVAADGQVTFADGSSDSVEQMASDVAMFLTWTAEPTLEARKQTGLKVLLFLIVMTGLFYATKRKIWAAAH